MRAALFSIEGKGGVGKSTTSGLAIDAVSQDGKRSVSIIDGDTTNSTMASMYDNVDLIDTSEEEAAGLISAHLKSSHDYMVMDMGARSEAAFIQKVLPRLMRGRKKTDVEFVALRPLTLSVRPIKVRGVEWSGLR